MLSRTTFPPSPLHTSISISLSDNILNWSRNRKLIVQERDWQVLGAVSEGVGHGG